MRNAAPMVGSLFGWKSFWQNRSTTDDLPTADSPASSYSRGVGMNRRVESSSWSEVGVQRGGKGDQQNVPVIELG